MPVLTAIKSGRYLIALFLIMFVPKGLQAGHFRGHEFLEEYNFYSEIAWESRYVTEGRDNLDGDPIQSTFINLQKGIFALALWNGWGYNSNYDELNIVPKINFRIENYSFYLAYNRKIFLVEDEVDNELGFGVSYDALPYGFFTAIDWYHSFNADGSFLEFSFGTEIEPHTKVELEPSLTIGINNNYIPDGHDGLNHVSLGLNAEYRLAPALELYGFFRYNQSISSDPLNHPGDVLLDDFFWGGIGVELEY